MRKREKIEVELDHFRESHPPPVQYTSWEVRYLLNHIHDELFDPALNVQVLKQRCHIRDNNISCRFKYEMGISIRRYIESLRLEAASVLLRQHSFTAAEVARSVGYPYIQTFYRAFKRQFRCTPGVIRRQGRGSKGQFRAK